MPKIKNNGNENVKKNYRLNPIRQDPKRRCQKEMQNTIYYGSDQGTKAKMVWSYKLK